MSGDYRVMIDPDEHDRVIDERNRYRSALAAIHHRLNGYWDSEHLKKLGPLMPKAEDDILRICELANEGKWPS